MDERFCRVLRWHRTVLAHHRSYEFDSHQWALAIDAATPSASYRPDLLGRLGVALPSRWET
jgi:multiple sugar transport system substrate-binding protein